MKGMCSAAHLVEVVIYITYDIDHIVIGRLFNIFLVLNQL